MGEFVDDPLAEICRRIAYTIVDERLSGTQAFYHTLRVLREMLGEEE